MKCASATRPSIATLWPVASKAAGTFLGSFGAQVHLVVFVVSALGALNGFDLVQCARPLCHGPRWFVLLAIVASHPHTRVPVACLVLQAFWASVLALSGTFDQLTDCLLFASWIFYGLVASSVFVLRYRLPNLERPYRTFGYPVIPLLFLLVAFWLIINTFMTKRVESMVGIVLMLAGLPLYATSNSIHRPKVIPTQVLPAQLAPAQGSTGPG